MVSSFLPSNYVPLAVTSADIKLASIAWGFTLGVGALTSWKALKQTQRIARTKRFSSIYVWMIWGEIGACLAFSIICWLHLNGNIPPSLSFFFGVLTCWSLQVQLLLQIIINRIGIIDTNTRRIRFTRYTVAIIVTIINISVYCIWIPARLQISAEYIRINDIWDRCEKTIYLVLDACLNCGFIWTVRKNLVKMGLEKYRTLMHVNIAIVVLSLSMDILIIAMMSLRNTFVYCQFHPLAYIVKLHIELHLADLIAEIAKQRENTGRTYPNSNHHASKQFALALDSFSAISNANYTTPQGILKTQDIRVETNSVGKDSNASGQLNVFNDGDNASEGAVGARAWAKCSVGTGGDEEPLREGETWETSQKDSKQDFPS